MRMMSWCNTAGIGLVLMATACEAGELEIIEKPDVVYGRVHGAGLLADIAYPAQADGAKPLTAVISVHGGRWRGGNKKDRSTIVVKQWAGFGLFAMSIDYRLVGCSPAPACYQDLQCAIRYVHAHAKQYNIDPLIEHLFVPSQRI